MDDQVGLPLVWYIQIAYFNVFNFCPFKKFTCTVDGWIIVIWLCSTRASFVSLMNALPSSVSDKQASEEFLSAYMD